MKKYFNAILYEREIKSYFLSLVFTQQDSSWRLFYAERYAEVYDKH